MKKLYNPFDSKFIAFIEHYMLDDIATYDIVSNYLKYLSDEEITEYIEQNKDKTEIIVGNFLYHELFEKVAPEDKYEYAYHDFSMEYDEDMRYESMLERAEFIREEKKYDAIRL